MLLIIIPIFWLLLTLLLFLWKRDLFLKTWKEPYFSDTPLLIESDDWGPGGDFHADRLNILFETLSKHKDSIGRCAVLTADVVLAVPDTGAIKSAPADQYPRKLLDRDFPKIYRTMLQGIANDVFVPQLHGLEHLNGEAFAKLCQREDPRTEKALADSNWWDWETLDSPLQGHYVDGSSLPTRPITPAKAQELITTATATFENLFGQPSLTTVAPCYLWNDDIESEWSRHSILAIQTAGYRCPGRAQDGRYIQDKPLIRAGDANALGQIYLVRNVMFEPVDGKNTPETAYQEALQARRQASAITISTHRYNFTRDEDEFKASLAGLDSLLDKLTRHLNPTRFLSSCELAETLRQPRQPVINHFNKKTWPHVSRVMGIAKLSPFLYRLYYRHSKLVTISYLSGLIVPAWLICQTLNRLNPVKS
ncbi:MAG: hypothetical protein CVV13_03635 [Gammaproteobacteria bacterium HGW-Gammaproteobacteria-3]|nr:MAG: hypothetical protein CVV13_03635 [Gammaproteobacteria bacterium HGW-Gammaproteobacteria-3]